MNVSLSRFPSLCELWELVAEGFQLRYVIANDIDLVGARGRPLLAVEDVVLMVVLGAIESLEGSDLGHDAFGKRMRGGQLFDVSLGDALLLVGGVKNLRTVLRALVGILTVQLSRIVYGEVDLQQLTEGDLGGFEGDFDRSAWPVVPVLTISYWALALLPPE
jgi:hypothetical protein